LKPDIYVIGLGHEGLNKLSLETYETLLKAKTIYVWTKEHPAVLDMLQAGFPCIEINEKNTGEEWEVIVRCLKKHKITAGDQEVVVLALPGNPLREGKTVTHIGKALPEHFRICLDLLADDHSLTRLTEIMAELRSAWGCPWDREQTHLTLKKYLIEEAYEVIEAIDTKNMNNFCEELGDLLLQVVFHAQIAREENNFSLDDVLKGISDKLVRRHPHVFGSEIAESSEEVLVNWEAIKKSEKVEENQNQKKSDDYMKITKALPALLLAEEAQKKAAKVGFDWDGYHGPLAKIKEELAELEKEIETCHRLEEELGDLLFSIVNVSRFLKINAEEALRKGTLKFQKRFNKMVELIGRERLETQKISLDELDFYWDQVKIEEKTGTLGSF